MREDFLAFKEYYHQATTAVPPTSFYRHAMDHKFKHSIEVLHIGEKIIQQTPELTTMPETFKNLAKKALLFHDVGRFEEYICLYRAEQKKQLVSATSDKYDHALLGYKLLKQNKNYNDNRILIPIKYHSKMTEQIFASKDYQKAKKSPLFEDIEKILLLVRDADKLSNLCHIKKENHLTKDLFYKQLSPQALNAGLTPIVKEQFLKKQTILFPTVHSFTDRTLMVLSWIFDLNYQKTREIFYQEEYDRYLFELLKTHHIKAAEIKQLKQCIKKYNKA